MYKRPLHHGNFSFYCLCLFSLCEIDWISCSLFRKAIKRPTLTPLRTDGPQGTSHSRKCNEGQPAETDRTVRWDGQLGPALASARCTDWKVSVAWTRPALSGVWFLRKSKAVSWGLVGLSPRQKHFSGVSASACDSCTSVSYTHLTLPTRGSKCRSRWSPYH